MSQKSPKQLAYDVLVGQLGGGTSARPTASVAAQKLADALTGNRTEAAPAASDDGDIRSIPGPEMQRLIDEGVQRALKKLGK